MRNRDDVLAGHGDGPTDRLNRGRFVVVSLHHLSDHRREAGLFEVEDGSRQETALQGYVVLDDPAIDFFLKEFKRNQAFSPKIKKSQIIRNLNEF